MQVNVQQISPVLVEFAVEIPQTDVRRAVDNAYRDLGRTAKVRGYRQGKIPREVLSHVYGGQITQNVQQKLIDDTLPRALSQQGVQPLATLAISPNRFDPATNFSYRARFEVSPAIEKVVYEGFSIRRPATEVRDEDLTRELETLRQQHATLRTPEPPRPAREGDQVVFDFQLEVDGKPIPEGKGENVESELGKGTTLKELDQGLVGASAGDQKDIAITFSEQHAMPTLRGKSGVFKVTVKEVKERVLPDLDDEFAKDQGEHENLGALKESIKARLGRQQQQQAEDAVAEQLVVELCRANPIPVPPSLVQRQAEITAQEMQAQARARGQQFRLDDQTRNALQVDAEMKVRAGLLMASIARSHNVTVNDQDIEKAYVELSEQTGKNINRLRAEYREKNKRDILVGMILEDKILDIIEGKAVADGAAAGGEGATAAAPAEAAGEAASSTETK